MLSCVYCGLRGGMLIAESVVRPPQGGIGETSVRYLRRSWMPIVRKYR